MSRRRVPVVVESDPLTLAAATWLACGIVLLGLTPLPLHDATLGWSPAFWLLVAPSLLLVARRMCARRLALQPAALRKPESSIYAATPLRLASIRRNSSRMMR
ncbi:MAG TPA: hypothetical protein VFW60_09725 [Rhodanobacteraceae bacterium]|nr:hypothetical protein [Rhodanobacteraceae bacterium]